MADTDIPYERLSVPVAGGQLAVGRWGRGPQLVLASHGITANHRSWLTVAEQLLTAYPECSLVAVDHRGRAGSAEVKGPYGLRRHADDLALVLDDLGAEQAVIAGHSMGAFVATLMAEQHPARCRSLVLVDGGLPLPLPAALADIDDAETLVHRVIGPALERLDLRWPDRDAYLTSFAAHPAFQPPNRFPTAAADYMRYDAIDVEAGEVASSVSKAAVLEDGGAVINDPPLADAIRRISCKATLLWAPRGLIDQTPGLYTDVLVTDSVASMPHLNAQLVDNCNHYTLLLDPDKAAAVVAALQAHLLSQSV